MSRIDHNAPQFKYRVYWKRVNSTIDDWEQVEITDWRRSFHVVPNQPTYVPYHIRVEAENELGESNVSPIPVIGYSGEDGQ